MIVNGNEQINSLEIVATKSVSEFEWNRDIVVGWAKEYAARFVGLMVSEDNLKDMEDAKKELSSKRRRLDDFRKQEKAKMEGPIKKFEAEVKEVIAIIDAVETPIAEQVRKFEDQRRCEQATEIAGLIRAAVEECGLRKNFADQIVIAESWTNRTAIKSKIKAEIESKVRAMMQMQQAEDQAEEMKRQRAEMAVMMCRIQSEAAGLAVAIEPKDIYGISNLTLSDLPAAITTAVSRRKESEQAAIDRAERQKIEAAEREAKRIADAEAARVRQAEINAAREAVARIEAQTEAVKAAEELPFAPPAPPIEKQFKIDVSVFGTESDLTTFLSIIETNGYNYVVGKMEEVKGAA